MTTKTRRKNGPLSDTRGLATVEYVLIACLVALMAFGANKSLGGSLTTKVDDATAVIAQLPGDAGLPALAGDFSMAAHTSIAIGSLGGLGAAGGGGGESGGCSAHVARGGGDGAPCDPRSFGSCATAGDAPAVVSCDATTGLTVSRAR